MKPPSATTSQSASAATGLACFFLWLVVHSSLFRFQKQHVEIGSTFEYEAFSIAVNAAILFALFFAYLRKRAVPFGRSYFAAIGACLLLGYLTGVLIDSSAISDPALSSLVIAQCILTNVGMSCLSLEWIRILGIMGTGRSIPVLAAGSIMAALLLALCQATNLLVTPLLPGSFPVLSLLAVVLFHRRRKQRDESRVRAYGSKSNLAIPYGLLATVFLSDFAGAAVLLLARVEGLQMGLTFSMATFLLSAIALLLTAGFYKLDFNNLIYKVAYGLMAAGCLLLALPLAGSDAIGILTQQTGYRFMLLLTYLLSAWLIENKQLSANWVYPVVTGVAFVGMFIGQETAALCARLWGLQMADQVLCAIFASALPFAALMLAGTGNARNAWGFSSPSAAPVPRGERIDRACAQLADDFALTKREAEVFTLIAKGYSRKFISEQLVLSPETVKAYANKMYAKVNVHSRQDLIVLVNERMAEEDAD